MTPTLAGLPKLESRLFHVPFSYGGLTKRVFDAKLENTQNLWILDPEITLPTMLLITRLQKAISTVVCVVGDSTADRNDGDL